MRLLSIATSNFRLHADTRVEFPDGIIGICGSNEAGKSTLATEAICWALYGGDALRGTKGSVRWNRAPARRTASVELRFEVGGKEYCVERTENNAKLWHHGGFDDHLIDRVLAEGTKPVNEYVRGLLGMDLEQFTTSYMCLQKDVARLASLTPMQRQTFVRDMLGVGKIDTAIKAVRARKNEVGTELSGLLAGLGEREPLAAALERARDSAGATTDLIAEVREHLQGTSDLLHEAKGRLHESGLGKDEYDKALRARDAARAKRDQAASAARQAERHVADMRAQKEKRQPVMAEEIRQLQARIAEGESAVAMVAGPAELSQATTRHDAAHKLFDHLRRKREEQGQRHLAAAHQAEDDAAKLDAKIRALRKIGAEAPCPTCTRIMADQFETVIGALETQSGQLKHRVEDARLAAESFREPDDEEVAAEVAADEAIAEVERIRGLQRDAEVARKRLEQDRASLLGASRHLQDALEATEKAEFRFEEAQSAAVLAEDTLHMAETVLEGVGFDAAAHKRLEQEAEAARQAHEATRVALARAEGAEQAARTALAAAEHALAAYDERAGRVAELQAAHLTHERADARLNAFRTFMASTIRPALEEYCSGFVALLTDGRHESVEIDEDFNLTLHEGGVPIEVASGGTEDVAALALRLALSQLIAERAGHPLSLLVLDEPFGSLDEVRRGNVLSLIRRLKGVFRQVLVISHVAETRDSVDHVIELEYDEGEGRTRVVRAPTPVTEAVTAVA